MFSLIIRISWCAVFLTTLASEIVPLPPMFLIFSSLYICAKALLFLALGFLTPLSFRRFNSLNYGFLVGASATALVEISQHWIPGHTFSLLELLGKWGIIFAGFALSLDARYARRIKLGVLRVSLHNKDIRSTSQK